MRHLQSNIGAHIGAINMPFAGAHFDDCFTYIWDGAPIPGYKPTNWETDEPEDGFGGADLWAGIFLCMHSCIMTVCIM